MSTYSIITPVKNEINSFEKTVNSVVSQSILPIEWIIVDDGSNDGTEVLLEEIAKKYSWIKVLKPQNNTLRDYSSRVVFLFNFGYSSLLKKPEFISKLDGDVSFNSDFYKNIINSFESNPKLGIASGHLTLNNIPETNPATPYVCTRGATKVYRYSCLIEIGGIIPFQGWDTLDNIAARAKGWEVAILPEYFEHLKEEGSKVGNKLYSNFRIGFYNGSIPYLWTYFIVKCISKSFKKPIILGSLLQLIGYIKGRFFYSKRPFPEYIIIQLHKEQKFALNSLFSSK